MKSKVTIMYTLTLIVIISFNTSLYQLKNSDTVIASPVSVTAKERIIINGNTDYYMDNEGIS